MCTETDILMCEKASTSLSLQINDFDLQLETLSKPTSGQ